jgi:hypothetical protein
MLRPLDPDAELEREEAWHAALPRCDKLDGNSLTLLPREEMNIPEPEGVAITDGERTAIYAPAVVLEVGDPTGPREIVRAYTEAGWFCEANLVTIRKGWRPMLYQPVRIIGPADEGAGGSRSPMMERGANQQ